MNETTLKQPREDIATGSDRDDDLLSLEEAAIAHRDALIAMARLLYTACLVGDPAPVVQDIYKQVAHPKPGDLVVEMTALHDRSDEGGRRRKGLGILLERREEWYETDEEYAAAVAEGAVEADEPRMTDEAWYIQYGSNAEDVCRWTNCRFIALPLEWRDRW